MGVEKGRVEASRARGARAGRREGAAWSARPQRPALPTLPDLQTVCIYNCPIATNSKITFVEFSLEP